jgi:cell division protein FtsI/penicillin-binding protein 2
VGTRRTRPLVIIAALLAAVVIGRLYQIQVVEHRTWSDEARRLELSGAVLPYDRGPILDSTGAPLVEDAPGYRLELDYRDFRRGAPLGQVAHARSTVLGRPVTLFDALANLEAWATELVLLAPGELHDFGKGAGLRGTSFDIPATERPFDEQRAGRASDLRYYVVALLDVDDDEKGELRRLERRSDTRDSYLRYLARLRDVDERELLADLRAQWLASVERLRVLARRLEWEGEDALGALPIGGAGSSAVEDGAFTALVSDLEGWRRSVEDAASTALFRELYGFHPGRIAPATLVERFDLDWLERRIGWDRARVASWAEQARFGYLHGWRAGYALPRLLARVRLDGQRPDAEHFASIVLGAFARGRDFVAALDGRPTSWRELDELAVLDDLPRVLELDDDDAATATERPPLDPLDPAERELVGATLEWVEATRWIDETRAARLYSEFVGELGTRLESTYGGTLAGVLAADAHRTQAQRADRTRRLALALLDTFEDQFQVALTERLAELAARSPGGLLTLDEERRDRLSERARHLIKDYSSRAVTLHDDPDYDVVFLLTRDAEHYPGVRVVPVRERRTVPRGPEGLPLAQELVGDVALLDANGEIRQRAKSQRLKDLRRDVTRSDTEERELAELMQELLRRDELRGVSGIEASFDAELRGANGYQERIGLEDVYGRGARDEYLTAVEDGDAIRLTIDPDLQRAARETINRPRPVLTDPKLDDAWYAEPVGAIVLLDIQGRVLAAASAPDSSTELDGDEEGERARIVERVFGRPNTFQPVGSVYKPFVALWALDRVPDFDASFMNDCAIPPGETWAEYGGLRCHAQYGHGQLTLPYALAVSCNPYFARLADVIGFEGVVTVGYDFGFTESTGVLAVGDEIDAGRGLNDWGGRTFEFDDRARMDLQLRRAANGLQVVEASPAQVARAYLTLARGSRVPLRLVDAVGDREVPWGEPVPLPYARASLDELRGYLEAVTNANAGSASDTLSRTQIGHVVVAKTGSADLSSRTEDGGAVRKHTWVAGWLPAEDPQIVFAVYVHDTTATSGHSAGYVARDLLQKTAVMDWLKERGYEQNFAPYEVRIATGLLSNPSRVRDPRSPR